MQRLPAFFFKPVATTRQRRGWRARRPHPAVSSGPRHNRLQVILAPESLLAQQRFSALWSLEDELCSLAEL